MHNSPRMPHIRSPRAPPHLPHPVPHPLLLPTPWTICLIQILAVNHVNFVKKELVKQILYGQKIIYRTKNEWI